MAPSTAWCLLTERSTFVASVSLSYLTIKVDVGFHDEPLQNGNQVLVFQIRITLLGVVDSGFDGHQHRQVLVDPVFIAGFERSASLAKLLDAPQRKLGGSLVGHVADNRSIPIVREERVVSYPQRRLVRP